MYALADWRTAVCQLITVEAGSLLVAVTVPLALGCLAVWLSRTPVQRQRSADLTIFAALVWLVLALIPLPRPAAGWWNQLGRWTSDPSEIAAPAVVAPQGATSSAAPASPSDILVSEASEPSAELLAREREFAQLLGDLDTLESAENETVVLIETGRGFPWIASVWLLGSGAAVAWLLLGHALLLRISRSQLPLPPWFERLWLDLPWQNTRRPRLVLSPRIRRAMTWGIWRATIGVPASICQPKRADQLRHILLHEMGHIVRRDAWSVLLCNLAMPVLYFHPLFWYLRNQSRLAAELLADDWAAGHSSPEAYVQQLVAFVKAGKKDHALAFSGLSFFENPTRFYRRMHMLLDRRERLSTRCGWTWRCAATLLATLLTGLAISSYGVTPATAQSDEQAAETAFLVQFGDSAVDPTTPPDPVQEELKELRKACEALRLQAEKLSSQLEKLEARRHHDSNDREGDYHRKRRLNEWKQHERKQAEEADQLEKLRDAERAAQAKMAAVQAALAEQQANLRAQQQAADGAIAEHQVAETLKRFSAATLSPSMDVMSLATALIDAQADLEEAQMRLSRMKELSARGFTNDSSLAEAKIRERRAARKAELLTNLARLSLESAKQEYRILQQQVEAGVVSVDKAAGAEGRYKLLQEILRSTASDGDSDSGKQEAVTEKSKQKVSLSSEGVHFQEEDRGAIAAYNDQKQLLWITTLDPQRHIEIKSLQLNDNRLTVQDANDRTWVIDAKTGEVQQHAQPGL